ncbi:hypothetical protein ABK040_010044 [Willaertia magna]
MSEKLLSRIAFKPLQSKIVPTAKDCIKYFQHGMNLGWSGFTPVGYPKEVPSALANYVEQNNLQGKLKFNLFIGASVGAEEDKWAQLDMINSRWPYQSGSSIAKGINDAKIDMGDIHLSLFAADFAFGFFTKDLGSGKLDIGVIECTEITNDGKLILGGSVGISPEIVDKADKLIIEVNTTTPSFKGFHDILPDVAPPFTKPYLITKVDSRVGDQGLQIDPSKVIAIVEGTKRDGGRAMKDVDENSMKIAGHIMEFLDNERKQGRLPKNLLPLQSGVGNIANAVLAGLAESSFSGLQSWTEVLQDKMLDLMEIGKLDFVSTAAVSLSSDGFDRFYKDFDEYRKKVIVRPQHITNHPGIIRRLGVIAMNTPIEVDIYGHANSTLIQGSKMVHGIGGSGDFLRNSYISIMHTPSARPSKTDPTGISCIVPMCSHIDHTEHDLQVIVTEQGLADLRGVTPRKRAKLIIDKCAHPDYKDMLHYYYKKAEGLCLARHMAHEPQILSKCHNMHVALDEQGSMKKASFD